MIITLKGADFSENNIGKVTTTTTWYVDYRKQASVFDQASPTTISQNVGWSYFADKAEGLALIGKPINTIHLFTGSQSSTTFTFAKASVGSSTTTLIATVTATKASDGNYTIFRIPETTLQSGEVLVIHPADHVSEPLSEFYFAEGNHADDNGLSSNGFHGAIPQRWSTNLTTYTLGMSVGYTV